MNKLPRNAQTFSDAPLDFQPRRGARFYILLAAVAALVAVIAFIAYPKARGPVAETAKPKAALTVTTATPHSRKWSSTLIATGSVAPWQEAIISAQVGGYHLIEVLANVGDQVTQGQVLARLDSALLRADEAQLAANHEQAEANRQRAVALKSSGNMSEQASTLAITQAKAAAALLEAKRLQVRYATIVAPDAGVISARNATLGAVAPAGQELFRLIRQNRLEWRGELTAAQLLQIAPGQRITLTLPNGSVTTAVVRQTAPSLDSQSRLGIAYADIERGSQALAGMYAKGEVTLKETEALAVPDESVMIRDGRSYVARVASANAATRVSLQAVTVGRRRGHEVEIVEGLTENDRIVVLGAGFLNEGDLVNIAPSEASQP